MTQNERYLSAKELYAKIGVKTTLADIGVDEAKADLLLETSPCVRNRLTLMRLRRGLIC